ncbi:AraC family transcriptional regulator [Roseomonas nepalensis]|uniref:AraC family transcriptional regulator n=1 Tax=Muricoccus nepalensis TaxID=1854500 RepID=A0A502F9F3_9PROT|nr:AraC family transcriptional regulator [Roseomonas nepalensis]TPG46026.1 AraC family transcriptional regulator [Roseomonas nepalensis]
MDLKADGARKYGSGGVLTSSRTLTWRGLAADLRHHPAGELPPFKPQHLEIGIAVSCHPEAVVSRKGNGLPQRTRVEPGIVWLCPAGVLEEDIRISEWHDVLHLYLPIERLAQNAELRNGAGIRPDSIRYLAGLHDELIRQVGWAVLAEMRAPTAAGQMRVESMALALTARIAERYVSGIPASGPVRASRLLDERRLHRVLEYMAEHLEDEIGLNELAAIAYLSPFHFNRMFTKYMGVPPHRYLGRLRLERAKTLLATGRLSLAEIAVTCCFSSQSNFSRAFRRAAGISPLRYRREAT